MIRKLALVQSWGSLSDLDRISKHPQHSFKLKLTQSRAPTLFIPRKTKGGEEAAKEKLETMRLEERSIKVSAEAASTKGEAASSQPEVTKTKQQV